MRNKLFDADADADADADYNDDDNDDEIFGIIESYKILAHIRKYHGDNGGIP